MSRMWACSATDPSCSFSLPTKVNRARQRTKEDPTGHAEHKGRQRTTKTDPKQWAKQGAATKTEEDSRPHKTTKVGQKRWPQDKGRERRASGHAKGRKSTKEFRAKERTTLHNRGQEDKGQQRDTRKGQRPTITQQRAAREDKGEHHGVRKRTKVSTGRRRALR